MLFRNRGWLPIPFLLVPLLAPGTISPSTIAVGLLLMVLGEWWRMWGVATAGTVTRRRSREVHKLVSHGPFSWSRNPLYVGNFLIWIGVIALSGMIMRNSVILVDQIEQDIAAGSPPWIAIVDSTVRRFRPIVLTAAAAVLAMIPLTRSAFFGPMAVAIMGGLIVATALTLLFLPALYAAWFRVKRPQAP